MHSVHMSYSVVADQYLYTILWHWEYRGCVDCQGQMVERGQGVTWWMKAKLF